MILLFWIGILVIALVVLVKAADVFTNSAEKIGLGLGMPRFLIGVTIVSIGTTLPELFSSVIAVLQGNPEIVAGNVMGSCITNIFLVLGVAALISKKFIVSYEMKHVDLPLLMGSALLMTLFAWDGVVNLYEGIFLLLGGIIYITYLIHVTKQPKHKIKREELFEIPKHKDGIKSILILILSAVFLYFGAKYTVNSVVEISALVGIGVSIISATAISLGTSLPELIVCLVAARKGKIDIAIGNVLGANILNAFQVLGLSAVIAGTLIIPEIMITLGIPLVLISTFMYYAITSYRKISRWEGALLVLFYLMFIGKSFGLF